MEYFTAIILSASLKQMRVLLSPLLESRSFRTAVLLNVAKLIVGHFMPEDMLPSWHLLVCLLHEVLNKRRWDLPHFSQDLPSLCIRRVRNLGIFAEYVG